MHVILLMLPALSLWQRRDSTSLFSAGRKSLTLNTNNQQKGNLREGAWRRTSMHELSERFNNMIDTNEQLAGAFYTPEQKEQWDKTLNGPGYYQVVGEQAYTFLVHKISRMVDNV